MKNLYKRRWLHDERYRHRRKAVKGICPRGYTWGIAIGDPEPGPSDALQDDALTLHDRCDFDAAPKRANIFSQRRRQVIAAPLHARKLRLRHRDPPRDLALRTADALAKRLERHRRCGTFAASLRPATGSRRRGTVRHVNRE